MKCCNISNSSCFCQLKSSVSAYRIVSMSRASFTSLDSTRQNVNNAAGAVCGVPKEGPACYTCLTRSVVARSRSHYPDPPRPDPTQGKGRRTIIYSVARARLRDTCLPPASFHHIELLYSYYQRLSRLNCLDGPSE